MKQLLIALPMLLVAGCSASPAPLGPKVTPMLADDGGLGPVHHWVSTKNPAAQRAFDEGLARLYGFNHDEAVKAFKRASEIDPECAMAYWGQALAIGPNYNIPEVDPKAIRDAHQLVATARDRSQRATQQERDYIDTLATRYADDPKADLKKLQSDYAAAMGRLTHKYPDDLDAATLYAEALMNLRPWQLYTQDGLPQPGTDTIVAQLQYVLERNPNHVGANHYYIHAVEASLRPERGLECAKRLATLAPRQGHLVHMPAHIYMRTGDYEAAVKANQQAIAADDRYISCCHPQPAGVYPVMYYNHNVHFLTVAACMTNQSKLALTNARRLANDLKPIAPQMPMAEPYCAMPLLVMVRFGMWDQILGETASPTTSPTIATAPMSMSMQPATMPTSQPALPTTECARHFARAMALAAKKDLVAARTEQGAFESARAAFDSKAPMGNSPVVAVMEVASHLLAGKIAQAAGDRRAAIDWLAKAVAAQDRLAYDEPPPWPWPVRESLGAALLLDGQMLAAEQVFREDLRRNPSNARSLLGLWRVLVAEERSDEAARLHRQFEQAEAGADVIYGIGDL
jgi:tetratricopeptide (TPR) repeat protein